MRRAQRKPGSIVTVTIATALVTEPPLLEITSEYPPTLLAPTFVNVNTEVVAPKIFVPLNRH